MSNQDKLEKDFIRACGKIKGGQYLSRIGYLDCFLKNKPMLVLTLSTSSPTIKVESGLNHVEMWNVKSILSNSTPNTKGALNRIEISNNEGHIIHIRPDIGVVTFNGDVKGALG